MRPVDIYSETGDERLAPLFSFRTTSNIIKAAATEAFRESKSVDMGIVTS